MIKRPKPSKQVAKPINVKQLLNVMEKVINTGTGVNVYGKKENDKAGN